MEKMYSDSDFDKLETGVEKVCEELKSKVFGEASSIEKGQWIQQAMTPNFSWLFKLDGVRKKVHEASGVQMLHVNELEAKKHLDRLKQEQERMRE